MNVRNIRTPKGCEKGDAGTALPAAPASVALTVCRQRRVGNRSRRFRCALRLMTSALPLSYRCMGHRTGFEPAADVVGCTPFERSLLPSGFSLGADRLRLCFKLIPLRDPELRFSGVYRFRHSRMRALRARQQSPGAGDRIRTCTVAFHGSFRLRLAPNLYEGVRRRRRRRRQPLMMYENRLAPIFCSAATTALASSRAFCTARSNSSMRVSIARFCGSGSAPDIFVWV
jgi:hypothetical protein